MHTCYSPVRRSPAKVSKLTPPLPLDLHVLSLSLAFILSQDQTLRCCILSFSFFLALNTRPRGLRHGSLRATLARHSTVCPNPVAPESLLFIASTFQYDLSRVKLKLLTETSSRHCLCHLVSNLFLRTTFVLFARISMTFPLPLPSVLMPRRSRKRVQNYTFSPNWQNLSQYFFRLFSHPPPQLPTNQPVTPQKNFNKKRAKPISGVAL